jgi:SPOR domain
VKHLFLILLLANLLFWGWRLWVAPPEVPAMELRTPGKEPRIALLRPATPAPGSPGGNAVVGSGSCVRVGPIADGEVAGRLKTRLEGNGFAPSIGDEAGQVWVGYWVQLEAVATREEADAITARLAAGGLPDAYVLTTGAPYPISLGVFRDRERADAVVATATGLGFRPQVSDRYRAGVQYWLTLRMPTGRSLSLDELGKETGQILRSEPANCP